MIIIDYNQICIANLFMSTKWVDNINEDAFRHMVLNSIKKIKNKFSNEYGDIVIAADANNYWRKEIYPFYKAHRKKNQEESEYDWNEIFGYLNNIREEIKEYFSYRVIRIDTAEADDIIASLVLGRDMQDNNLINNDEKILIVSGDKDFIQLQKYKDVVQYDSVHDKYVKHDDPESFLKEHILRGDAGDGIPNFLSPDDTFVEGKRQKTIRKNNMERWMNQTPLEIKSEGQEQAHGYYRNDMLINLSLIPQYIIDETIIQYAEQSNKKSKDLLNYFMKHKLKKLMTYIQDF